MRTREEWLRMMRRAGMIEPSPRRKRRQPTQADAERYHWLLPPAWCWGCQRFRFRGYVLHGVCRWCQDDPPPRKEVAEHRRFVRWFRTFLPSGGRREEN